MTDLLANKSNWAPGKVYIILFLIIPTLGISNSYYSPVSEPSLIPLSIDCPSDITVECIDEIPEPDIGSVSFTDTCGGNVTIKHLGDVSDGLECPETITRTYEVQDTCGNVVACSQIITVYDQLPPVLIGSSGITVEDCSIIDAFNSNPWLPYSESEVTIDYPVLLAQGIEVQENCGISNVSYSDQTVSDYCPIIIVRTYMVVDYCGNTSTLDFSITIQDTYPPFFREIPEDITVYCDEIPEPPEVSAKDNCSCGAWMTFTEVSNTVVDCEGIIIRQWEVEDDCGNKNSITQTITVIPNTTGIDNLSDEQILEVYPNPGRGIFKLDLTTDMSSDINLSVRDLSGKIVLRENYSATDHDRHRSIDISNKPPGIYFLSLRTGSGVYTRRLVVW